VPPPPAGRAAPCCPILNHSGVHHRLTLPQTQHQLQSFSASSRNGRSGAARRQPKVLILVRRAVVQHACQARVLPLRHPRRCRNEAAVQRVGQLQRPGPLQLGKGAQGGQEGGPLSPLLFGALGMSCAPGCESRVVAQLLRKLQGWKGDRWVSRT